MIDFNKEFKTDRILIRPLQLEDAEEMFALTSKDSEMWIYFTADLSDRTALDSWVRTGVEDEGRLALTVVDIASNKIIGSTSIANISVRDRRVEIGWTWLAKAFQGKGYNAEVKLELMRYLFDECQVERLELKTDILNVAARKAMSKIGFVEEGILRSHTQMIRGRRRDTIYYSMLKKEWLQRKV